MSVNPCLSILIIDDSPTDQILLSESLKKTNLLFDDIVIATRLSEGINHLNTRNFSLIFLDLYLPDCIGLDSLSTLLKANARVPIIIYSGFSDTATALEAISLGAQDFLIKGDYNIRLLEKTIQYSIERKNISDALEKSNTRYNLISKATHEMMWDWDLINGEVRRSSDSWKKVIHTPKFKEDGTRGYWRPDVHPDDCEKVERVLGELIDSDTNQLFEVEFRVIKSDGTIGYIEDRGYINRDEKGNATHLIGASNDITERKNAEEKVMLSEQRFKSLIQNSLDLIAILDQWGNYIYVSPSSIHLLGYEPEFFIGRNTFDFIHEEDKQKTFDSLKALESEKFVVTPLFRIKNSSGNWRWIESTITNLLDDPAVRGIVVNSRDVTEKKIIDDELKKLSMVAKETNNGVVISDKDHKVLWVNNAFTKMYGYDSAEIYGRNSMEFLTDPQTNPELVKYINAQILKKESFVFEMIKTTHHSNKIYVRVQVQPILDENGTISQFFELQTDITRQKELEDNIEKEKMIRQNEITYAVFAAQENERTEIGRELHDNVNQILGAARLYIETARKGGHDIESLLSTSSEYTLTAIDEIRKLSKTLITPSIKEVGLADAIKDLAEEIMFVHPIEILLQEKDFEEAALNDKFKLNIFRIVQEQLNNTLKHSQAKKINVNIEETQDKLLIVITDDGIGFDMSKRKAGVGITNIKSRIELYNGNMVLQSRPGRGTTLRLTFDKMERSIQCQYQKAC